jgi:hypothetical protein
MNTMNMPGFTAEASFQKASGRYRMDRASNASVGGGEVLPQLGIGFGFGPTLPTCHYEKRLEVCGSPLPGYPAPMCWVWAYVCRFPGSSASNVMF